jgi:hypothetical protein
VESGGFNETASRRLAAFTVTGAASSATSVQPFVNLDITKNFITPSQIIVTPDAQIGYLYEAGRTGQASLTAADGTGFAGGHLYLAPNIAHLGVGLTAGKNGWSFYARYAAYLSGDSTAQTGEAGLEVRF